MTRLSLGCSPLDTLLGGGLEQGILTKFYGEAATGKTNVCLQAARECALNNGTVAFIDTEGVSIERLQQICNNQKTFHNISKKIQFYRPLSFNEQIQTINTITRRNDIALIIVDTLNLFYRLHLNRDKDEMMRAFSIMVGTLLHAARKKNYYIIVTEQVYTDKAGDIKPFSTRDTEHLAKTIILLEKQERGVRKATIIRHRSEPEGKETLFSICQNGIE